MVPSKLGRIAGDLAQTYKDEHLLLKALHRADSIDIIKESFSPHIKWNMTWVRDRHPAANVAVTCITTRDATL